MQNQSVPVMIFKNLFGYLISYVSHVFLTYSICEFITIIIMLITKTEFEKIFIFLISYTPTLGLWGRSSFDLGKNEIVTFVLFWSFILMLLNNILKRTKKVQINQNLLFVIFTIMHVVAIFRLRNISGMFFTISFFFFSSLISYAVYKSINKFNKYFDFNNNKNGWS